VYVVSVRQARFAAELFGPPGNRHSGPPGSFSVRPATGHRRGGPPGNRPSARRGIARVAPPGSRRV